MYIYYNTWLFCEDNGVIVNLNDVISIITLDTLKEKTKYKIKFAFRNKENNDVYLHYHTKKERDENFINIKNLIENISSS